MKGPSWPLGISPHQGLASSFAWRAAAIGRCLAGHQNMSRSWFGRTSLKHTERLTTNGTRLAGRLCPTAAAGQLPGRTDAPSGRPVPAGYGPHVGFHNDS